jgi:hypothetical protein
MASSRAPAQRGAVLVSRRPRRLAGVYAAAFDGCSGAEIAALARKLLLVSNDPDRRPRRTGTLDLNSQFGPQDKIASNHPKKTKGT